MSSTAWAIAGTSPWHVQPHIQPNPCHHTQLPAGPLRMRRARHTSKWTSNHAPATAWLVRPLQCYRSPTSHDTPPLTDTDHTWQPTSRTVPRLCIVHDYHQQLVPYHQAWQWQKEQVALMTSLPRSDHPTHNPTLPPSITANHPAAPPGKGHSPDASNPYSTTNHSSSSNGAHIDSPGITGGTTSSPAGMGNSSGGRTSTIRSQHGATNSSSTRHNSTLSGADGATNSSSTDLSRTDLSSSHGCTDWAILLQHPPVFTLGAGSTEANLLFDPAARDQPIPLVRTERGGEVTYHGPGQLVLYPLLDLSQHRQDLHWYMRALEEVVIRALWEVSGIRGERMQGLTGVWVGGEKVAAIGVRAKRWVTYHGLALNVCPDLTPFSHIIPCGIQGRGVTSVEKILQGSSGACTAVRGSLSPGNEGQRQELLDEYAFALLDALSEVFDLQLERT